MCDWLFKKARMNKFQILLVINVTETGLIKEYKLALNQPARAFILEF